MSNEQNLPFSVVSVVEDVLQHHGRRLSDVNLASRKAEEASMRRYEATGWLRKMVGVVAGKDLPAEPSEEHFRIGLRSGIILCNVLNKIQPGAVSKVIEAPNDSVLIPDGAALSAFQYFENVRNFLVAMEEMGLPTFEASDLEQGGKSSRIVNCVLALKSYAEGKLGGKNGAFKLGGVGNSKPPTSGKTLMRRNSEPFMKSLLTMNSWDRDGSMSGHSSYTDTGLDRNEGGPLNALIRQYLSDKKPEEIPIVVESLLNKVMEEFEQRLLIQNEMAIQNELPVIQNEPAIQNEPVIQNESFKPTQEDKASCEEAESSISKAASVDEEMKEKEEEAPDEEPKQEGSYDENENGREEEEEERHRQIMRQQIIVQQDRSIQELKSAVHQTKSGVQFWQKKFQEELISLSKHVHTIASAASGYHKVLEENRKLYNVVQDLKGNIRVYCRVRPFLGAQPNHNTTIGGLEEGNISITTPSNYGKEGKKTFNFNKCFGPAATQGEVFADTQPLIRSVLDGYNVCIFAYGQTGSGKTFTMSGPDDLTEETMGVNYRALNDLFLLSDQRKDTISYEISVQMLEIYNEQVRDLLATDGANKRLEIRNSTHNGLNVPDANLVPVSTTSDVISLMNLGQKNRAVGSTAMNSRSSRSHSCLTVHVQGKYLTSGKIIRSSMHLVDLAGSERADKTEATGDRLKEAQHINKSLSALGDVISSLAQKNSHVPYRNSKLTQLLQDALGGQAKTLMFVHISPEHDALGETLSTLKFAERVATVELGAARVNKDSADVKELKEQIASLKAALAGKDGEAEQFHQPVNSNQETPKLKSNSSTTPVQRTSSTFVGRNLARDDTSSLEGKKKDASKLKRRSLDIHDMYRNSARWPHGGGNQGVNAKDENKESISGDWDKIRMNRNDSLTSDDSLVSHWEAEHKEFSSMLSPSSFSEQDLHRHGYEMAITDDDLEIATSDSSESDLNWLYAPKPTTLSNGSASKPKKSTNLRPTKNTEARSAIPSLIPAPAPSRKQITVVSQPRKQPGTTDVKRRTK